MYPTFPNADAEDRACCCPAQPVVRVIMPPTPERPHSVDLLLCGHHYRVSRQALTAARARIEVLPGKADVAAALLEGMHRDRADVILTAAWPTPLDNQAGALVVTIGPSAAGRGQL